MRSVLLDHETDFDGWRRNARKLAAEGIPPEQVIWRVKSDETDLFDDASDVSGGGSDGALFVPRSFVPLAQTALLHCSPTRFAGLYRLLWRLRQEPRLLDVAIDPDVARVHGMAKAVRRDIHKMRAFVRFRRTRIEDAEWFVAWFEPDHHIVEANAGFFVRRFTTMRWSILTPRGSAYWDGANLSVGP